MKKPLLIGGVLLVILIGSLLPMLFAKNKEDLLTGEVSAATIDFYKSSSCGCCAVYADYLGRKSPSKVKVIPTENLLPLKTRFGIPPELQSCHTMRIGNYFVEGHVPVEAITKLAREQPDIAGIALPGMPSGAPGMMGGKQEPFIISAIMKDGTIQPFMTL